MILSLWLLHAQSSVDTAGMRDGVRRQSRQANDFRFGVDSFCQHSIHTSNRDRYRRVTSSIQQLGQHDADDLIRVVADGKAGNFLRNYVRDPDGSEVVFPEAKFFYQVFRGLRDKVDRRIVECIPMTILFSQVERGN